MIWKLALFEKGVKAHFIPSELFKDICDELYTRFTVKPFETYDKDQAWYDIGGMAMMDAKHLEWNTPGDLKFTLMADHFEYAYDELKNAEVREVNGKKYYKLHGWLHCIILTPAQRDFLLEDWEKNLQEYSQAAMMSNLEFERRMAEINKNGLKVIHKPRINLPKDKN